MSDLDAREPLDSTPSAATSGAGDGNESTRAGAGRDLAAVPSFLRSRLGATGPDADGSKVIVPRPAASARTAEPPSVPDVAALPMLTIAPRRLVLLAATIVIAWLIVSFGRQVAEASASSARADELRAANAALADEVAAMERELEVIQDQRYISQAARAFRLGSPGEIPFALAADAPPLAADAPGSAGSELGATTASMSPLERWLDVLFGPGD
ncbi:MAG: hypothetical protein L0227_01890 [Chloroflexi bacterium]|nr:hypothetical protein [Chloroflexota bacterium]